MMNQLNTKKTSVKPFGKTFSISYMIIVAASVEKNGKY